jgi:hypothetical protein
VKPGGYPFVDRDMNSCIGLRGCVTARSHASCVQYYGVKPGGYELTFAMCLLAFHSCHFSLLICIDMLRKNKNKNRWRGARKSGPAEHHDQSQHIRVSPYLGQGDEP